MKGIFLIYFFVCLCSTVLGSIEYEMKDETTDEENAIDHADDNGQTDFDSTVGTSDCWMSLDAAEHFKTMDEIDARYNNVRKQVQESLKKNDFDKSMIDGFIRSRGVAIRESYAKHHQIHMIPSGINLGGYCMLRMPESVLFFHRMKLRNNTYFRVDFLYNDLSNMVVTIIMGLNDLHLKGAYERSLTQTDPSVLLYSPTFGEVEFLLKDVKYKVEGRYRLIKNKLRIELVSSELLVNDILMTYINQAIESTKLRMEKIHLGEFMSRLKTDLNKWIKDYFNDYMMYAKMDGIPNLKELAKYDKEKGIALEEFTDKSIDSIATRIRLLNANSISVPTFTFNSITGLNKPHGRPETPVDIEELKVIMEADPSQTTSKLTADFCVTDKTILIHFKQIGKVKKVEKWKVKLYHGVINGLDSMYRRSVATGYKKDKIRKVDCEIGFSNLKVVYKYEAWIPTGIPPLSGVITLSSGELTAHLALAMVSNPETIDLDVTFLKQMKPESLTVEGAANIMLSNFKHLLEHQIVAIMSNSLIHGVDTLTSLPRCVPYVPGRIRDKKDPEEKQLSGDISDVWENEKLLRGKASPQRPSTDLLMKQSNKSVMKKSETELKKKYDIKRRYDLA